MAYADLVNTIVSGLRSSLSRAPSSLLHEYLSTVRPNAALAWSEAQVFLVGHDVARLLREKSDGLPEHFEIDFLPFPKTAFEFEIEGHRVIFLAEWPREGGDLIEIAHRGKSGWQTVTFLMQNGRFVQVVLNEAQRRQVATQDETERAIAQAYLWFGLEQIEGVCALLEAEVFDAERVDAPERLNRKRVAAGKVPLFGFHTLVVAKRTSAAAPQSTAAEPSRGVRLHIRRAHNHRFHTREGLVTKRLKATWVGDPDLGFIDKDYRI